mmetsp:Transcript_34118/g.82060  ORF Transcript_34118/g.82060 Transcript_34118/m.82060 type:complete len:721 (+) Transcript_34118:677-2839(+)
MTSSSSSPRSNLEEGSPHPSSSHHQQQQQLRHRSNNLTSSPQKNKKKQEGSSTSATTTGPDDDEQSREGEGVNRQLRKQKQRKQHHWWHHIHIHMAPPYFSRRAITSTGSGGNGTGSSGVSGSITNLTGAVGQQLQQQQRATSYRNTFLTIFVATVLYTGFLYQRGGANKYLGSSELSDGKDSTTSSSSSSSSTTIYSSAFETMIASGRRLAVTTWNIAAINNNPFEYWITYKENPDYEQLMIDIEKFLEEPADKDVAVKDVFTEDMFTKLDTRLTGVGWTSVRSYWESDFQNRKIVSGFMKDPLLGSKRLASMPDRITNTLNVEGGGGDDGQVYRPTVINMYAGDLSTQDKWWSAWESFMFDDKVKIKGKSGEIEEKAPYEMLQPIKKAKYPEIEEQEEKDSLPLQTMCGAIFDAILVHMMNTVSQPDSWQGLKKTMVENLNKKKVPHTLEILETTYSDSDVITLQEVSSAFIDQARGSKLGQIFHIIAPMELDAVRDQNSVIFLNKDSFPKGAGIEITSLVEASFPEGVKVPVAKGDILAITAENRYGVEFVFASFHGDTNGLATKPVLSAVVKAMNTDNALKGHRLVFGMDANTYENATPGKQQDVLDFGRHYVSEGLTSCWGDVPDPKNYTTYNARTFLQPQLNKACRSSEKRSKGDVNPKDFIVFPKDDFNVVGTWKDNTGKKSYTEDMAFPTLEFPSDHGILSTVLEPTTSNSN